MKNNKGNSNGLKIGAIVVGTALVTAAVATSLLQDGSISNDTGAKTIKITAEMIQEAEYTSIQDMIYAKDLAEETSIFELAPALDSGMITFMPDYEFLVSKELREEIEKVDNSFERERLYYQNAEPHEITSYKEFLEFLKENDLSLNEGARRGSIIFDRNKYPWINTQMFFKDGTIFVQPFLLIDYVNDFKNLTYEQMSDYIFETNEYDKNIAFAPTVIINTKKNHFTYPNGVEVSVLDDGTVIRTEKDGSAKTYKPGLWSTLHVYDYNGDALIVWESNIDCKQSNLGGVYRIITPTGEMHEKIFLNNKDGIHNTYLNDWAFAIKSSCGTVAYYNANGEMQAGVDNKSDDYCILWDVLQCEGEKGAEWIEYPSHFGNGSIKLYKQTGEYRGEPIYGELSVCNFNNSEASRFYGEATQEEEQTVITWNDGKKDYLVSMGIGGMYVGDGEILEKLTRKIEYPNGRSLEVDDQAGILIKQDGQLLGTINAAMVEGFPDEIWQNARGDADIDLANGDKLLLSEGKEYYIYGRESRTFRKGIYEGGSLTDISSKKELRGYKDGVFEIIKGVEKEKGSNRLPMRDFREKQRQYNSVSKVKQKVLKRGRF